MVFFISRVCYADPVWGTNMPDLGEWTVGFRNNIVFEDKLRRDYGKIDSTQYFCDLSLGITEWLSLDGRLGMGDIYHDAGDSFDIDYGTNFAGGYGVRVRVLKNDEYGVKGVVGFQHICVHPSVKDIGGREYRVILDAWQLSVVTSIDLDCVVPYIGATFARSDLIERVDNYRARKKGGGPFVGLAIGADIPLNSFLRFNVEGRFFDETGLSSGLLWRF